MTTSSRYPMKTFIYALFFALTQLSILKLQAQDFVGKQSEVWDLLKNHRMYKPKREIGYINSGRFNIEDYQHPLIKARLLEVLQNPPLTTTEIDSWVEGEINSSLKFDSKKFDEMAAKMAASTGKAYTEIRDSIDQAEAAYIKRLTLRDLESENRKIDKDVVLMCGWLDMQEAVPYLKLALQDSLVYDPFFVKMALARLQVEPYYSDMIDWLTSKEMITNYKYLNSFDAYIARIQSLFYIATPKAMQAIGEIIRWEGTTKRFSESELRYRISYQLLKNLKSLLISQKAYITDAEYKSYVDSFIINGRDMLALDLFAENMLSQRFYEDAAKWIEENFGKFTFNRYDPYTKQFPIDDDY